MRESSGGAASSGRGFRVGPPTAAWSPKLAARRGDFQGGGIATPGTPPRRASRRDGRGHNVGRMDPLLLVTGVLLLISGLLSLRSGMRLGLLLPVLAMIQVLVGLGAFGAGLMTRLSAGAGLAVVVPSIALMLGAAVWQGMRLRVARRIRRNSESARLETYMKYLSGGVKPD